MFSVQLTPAAQTIPLANETVYLDTNLLKCLATHHAHSNCLNELVVSVIYALVLVQKRYTSITRGDKSAHVMSKR